MVISLSFREWLLESESGVRSYLKANPKNPNQKFLVLYGNTFPIKGELGSGGMGFRYFQGTWSIPDYKITPEMRKRLEGLGVDMSGADQPATAEAPKTSPTMTPLASKEQDTKTDELLHKMKSEVDKAMSDNADPKIHQMLQNIDKVIENVAHMADEAGKQDFIKSFLKFSSKFHQYSLSNQILIWIQSHGKAEHVAGASKWTEMGRTVSKWDQGIIILRPNFKTINKKTADPVTGAEKEEKFQLKRFKAVKVYDVTATDPIPGHPSPFKPMTRADWSKDTNESREEIDVLVNSLLGYIKEKKLDFDYEKMVDEMGGYSAGGKIRINNTFKGMNLFSTLVHETAHELLHWMQTDKGTHAPTDRSLSRKEKEIDAETTAYVTLHHFGFESKDTPNYLALWQARGDDVRLRKQEIQKAASEIINGIKNHMGKADIEFSEE